MKGFIFGYIVCEIRIFRVVLVRIFISLGFLGFLIVFVFYLVSNINNDDDSNRFIVYLL